MTTPKSPMPDAAKPQDSAKAEILSEEDLDRVTAGLKTADLTKSTAENIDRTTGVASTASGGGSR
jgi:hypothetical protein